MQPTSFTSKSPKSQHGFTLVELIGVIVLLGIIGVGAMMYVGSARNQAITNTKARNCQQLNQLMTIAQSAGATIGAGASNNIDTTSAATAVASMNTGFSTPSGIPVQMKPVITTPASYTISGTAPNVTFGYNSAVTALP